MDAPVSEMQPAQLLEELRAISRSIGRTDDSVILQMLNTRTDLLEQEILRRMAW